MVVSSGSYVVGGVKGEGVVVVGSLVLSILVGFCVVGSFTGEGRVSFLTGHV